MTKIALISQNGDIGKSALACTIATEIARQGTKTICIDLDREHRELADWMEIRQFAGLNPVFEVAVAKDAKQAISLCPTDAISIIDCPSRATEATTTIAKNVDLVIMPVLPGSRKNANLVLDMYSQLVDAGIEQRKIVLIYSRVSTSTEITRSTEYLKSAVPEWVNLQILENFIPERAGYRNATTDGYALTETLHRSLNNKAVAVVDEIAEYVA